MCWVWKHDRILDGYGKMLMSIWSYPSNFCKLCLHCIGQIPKYFWKLYHVQYLKIVKFQVREITDIAAVFCNWNDTTCFSVYEKEREERDWGKTALSFGDEIEREYCWTRRSHSHSCCKYDFLCNKISFGRLQFGKFENNILLNLFFICLQQFVEEKMVGMMKNIPLCFSFLDLQGLVNFSAFLEHI